MNDELIAALEKATGPDRELDAEIYQALTGKCAHHHIMTVLGDGDGWGEVCSRCCEEEPYQEFKPYTASIDAALTLVPEGWCVDIHQTTKFQQQKWTGNGSLPEFDAILLPDDGQDPFGRGLAGYAPTPALAICVAALRARKVVL